MTAPEFRPGDRVWLSPPPLRCRRAYDLGTVKFVQPGYLEVRWDRCGLLMHLDWVNKPMDPIRHVLKEAARV